MQCGASGVEWRPRPYSTCCLAQVKNIPGENYGWDRS